MNERIESILVAFWGASFSSSSSIAWHVRLMHQAVYRFLINCCALLGRFFSFCRFLLLLTACTYWNLPGSVALLLLLFLANFCHLIDAGAVCCTSLQIVREKKRESIWHRLPIDVLRGKRVSERDGGINRQILCYYWLRLDCTKPINDGGGGGGVHYQNQNVEVSRLKWRWRQRRSHHERRSSRWWRWSAAIWAISKWRWIETLGCW